MLQELFVYSPLLGLLPGAILPPLFFAHDGVSLVVLNICGFILYMYPVALLASWCMAFDLRDQAASPEGYLGVLGLLALVFVALELVLFLLRWLTLGLVRLLRLLRGRNPGETNTPGTPGTPGTL